MNLIEGHVRALTLYAAESLDQMTHLNGYPVVIRYFTDGLLEGCPDGGGVGEEAAGECRATSVTAPRRTYSVGHVSEEFTGWFGPPKPVPRQNEPRFYSRVEGDGKTRGEPLMEALPTGGIINFNILKPDGSFVDFIEVESRAAYLNIHLRTGCFCNPGACQDFLGLTEQEMRATSEVRESCSDPTNPLKQRKTLGSVRVSMGYLTTFADVDAFLQFIRSSFNY